MTDTNLKVAAQTLLTGIGQLEREVAELRQRAASSPDLRAPGNGDYTVNENFVSLKGTVVFYAPSKKAALAVCAALNWAHGPA